MKCTLFYIGLLFLAAPLAGQPVIFVKPGATGANNGTSWANAYSSLQPALDAAEDSIPGTQVWVAAGTYKPTGAGPNGSFTASWGVAIYGGFSGTENALGQRNVDINLTVLSGDLAGNDLPNNFTQNRGDNSLHVLVYQGIGSVPALIDGFTIRGGHTLSGDNDPPDSKSGGGILTYISLTIRNSIFTENFAISGAGLASLSLDASSLVVKNSIFEWNLSTDQSAGIFMLNMNEAEINNSIFRHNTTNRGCVYLSYCVGISIDSCRFENNTAPLDYFGAGLFNWQSSYVLTNSSFLGNTAGNAAGIYNDGREGGDFFIIDNCRFENNIALDFGGGIYNWLASFHLLNCVFTGNEAGDTGAGIYNAKSSGIIENSLFLNGEAGWGGGIGNHYRESEVIIRQCQFNGNAALASGGGITNGFAANLAILKSVFQGNTAQFGGGVFNQNDSTRVQVDSSEFLNNTGQFHGGGLLASGGIDVRVTNSLFQSNTSQRGGGIAISEDLLDLATMTVENTVLRENIAQLHGAGMDLVDARVNLVNVVLAGNQNLGSGAGGAIYNSATAGNESRLTLWNSTLARNEAVLGAGIAQWGDTEGSAILELLNTIFYQPDGSNYGEEAGDPVVVSFGGNISSDNSLSAYLTGPNDLNEVDPLFVDPFTNNLHLQSGSPAIDNGIAAGAPPYDLEGLPRLGPPDSGAYEFSPVGVSNPASPVWPLALRPNPALDWAEISLENEWLGGVELAVYDAAGRELRRLTMEKTAELWVFALDVRGLPTGRYQVKAVAGGKTYTTVLVKG